MNIATRRRMAAGVVATATAVVAGLLVAPNASAADTITLSPNNAFNTETKTITITLAATSDGLGYPANSKVTFTRVGATPADSFSKTVDPTSDPTQPTVTVNFADVANNSGTVTNQDGPANVGTYSVTIADAAGAASDSCTACFQVLSPGPVSVTSVDPKAVAAGGSANVTVKGSGFSRGSVISVLLPDRSGPDTAITTNGVPTDDTDTDITNGVTTPTSIQRRWTVGAAAESGVRDVVVTNPDGTSGTCTGCFTVNGAPLTSVSPLAGSNDTAAGATSITFRGTNLNSGDPSLVFVGEPGSAAKFDLTIKGTNASYFGNSVTADFDLRNAAPGDNAYQPTLTQSDNSENTCTCRFSIAQPAVASITAVSPNTQKAGTTQTVKVTGKGLSKGVLIAVSGTGVTTSSVVPNADGTQADVTFTAARDAAIGARDLTPTTTDKKAGTPCKACYTIQAAAASPSPSATSKSPSPSSPCPSSSTSGTASPSATRSGTPSASASTSATGTPSATASGTPSGTASPSTSGSPSASSSPSGGILPSFIPAAPALVADTPTPSSSASASGTPSATASSSGSASGTPSATASSSASASSSTSPSSCASRQQATLTVEDDTIPAGSTARLFATGAPNQQYSLQCYTRPSTQYTEARAGTFAANGGPVTFTLSLGRNTRCFLQYATNSAQGASNSVVINVNTVLSLSGIRKAVKTYEFRGRNLPRVAGQLITLYRVDAAGNEIRTSNLKTDNSGIYTVTRKFTGTGTFRFRVRTSKTNDNAPGSSNTITVNVH